MKTTIVKKGLLAMLGLTLVVTSCSKDEDEATDQTAIETAALTAEQSQQASEAEISVDELFSVVELAYSEQEEAIENNVSFFPSCATVTVTFENGVKFVTLDFGTGCTLPNGNRVSGVVYLTYTLPVAGTATVTYRLENFAHNNRFVAGEGSLLRERNNANGNPQHTVNHELEITFPTGLVIQADGTRVAEWIEGFRSGVWRDNVFLVTGNRDLDFSTGFSHDALVISALRKEVSCPYFVSGQTEITRNNGTGVLDYGAGSCDNNATITINGETYPIILN